MNAQQWVDYLNELFALDPLWLSCLIGYKPFCNDEILNQLFEPHV